MVQKPSFSKCFFWGGPKFNDRASCNTHLCTNISWLIYTASSNISAEQPLTALLARIYVIFGLSSDFPVITNPLQIIPRTCTICFRNQNKLKIAIEQIEGSYPTLWLKSHPSTNAYFLGRQRPTSNDAHNRRRTLRSCP
jgi:hypothetical protein